jgi:hypothetical protein
MKIYTTPGNNRVILGLRTSKSITRARPHTYKVGGVYVPNGWDTSDRECARGLHFFQVDYHRELLVFLRREQHSVAIDALIGGLLWVFSLVEDCNKPINPTPSCKRRTRRLFVIGDYAWCENLPSPETVKWGLQLVDIHLRRTSEHQISVEQIVRDPYINDTGYPD